MEYNEEYTQWIKMNEKAWPIIKDDMPTGSLLLSRRLRMLYVLDGEVVPWGDKINTSNYDRAFPLLEQDQLQAMVRPAVTDWVKAKIFTDFLKDNRQYVDYSMEQLWLAFVMKELYNKQWDIKKEDWVDGS